jgi:hypothetical protein
MEFAQEDIDEIRAMALMELFKNLELIRSEIPGLEGEERAQAEAWAALFDKEIDRRFDMGY